MMILTLLLAVAAQVTPTPKLPPANAMPPPGTEEAAVLAPINALFAGIANQDGAAVLTRVMPRGNLTAVAEKADGTRTIRELSWADFAGNLKPGPRRMEERFIGQPAIEIDGDIAMVWGNYVFLVDGKTSHCGVNHADLVRDGGQWKILNITWTQRTTGCDAQ
jgi:hypothetical protein